jgi:hypothetical protein
MGSLFAAPRSFGDFASQPADNPWAAFPDWPPAQAQQGSGVSPGNPFLNALDALNPIGTAQAQNRRFFNFREFFDQSAPVRWYQWNSGRATLRQLDPNNPQPPYLSTQNWVPSNQDIARLNTEIESAVVRRITNFVMPGGKPIGEAGGDDTRTLPGGEAAARAAFNYLSVTGTDVTPLGYDGTLMRLPGNVWVGFRNSSSGPAVDLNVPGIDFRVLHYP